jgi:hypothetical protein
MNIELHIDELVLHGFSSSDRYHIGDAVENELARLLTERSLPPMLSQGGEVAHLDGGAFHVGGPFKANTVGSQIAHAVYGGFKFISNETKSHKAEPSADSPQGLSR